MRLLFKGMQKASLVIGITLLVASGAKAQAPYLMNDEVDIRHDFRCFTNIYFLADELTDFDPATGKGTVRWQRAKYEVRKAFNNMLAVPTPTEGNEFPTGVYAVHPELPFSIDFVGPRTVRVRMNTASHSVPQPQSLMLVGEPPVDNSWKYSKTERGHVYTGQHGSITITQKPWHIEVRDAQGKLLTRTRHLNDNRNTLFPALPFSFVRRSSDYSRSMAATFSLFPGEKIFGMGESYGNFDKVGQRVVLWVDDPNGAETELMHKPIPFFMSNRGYGMFMHTSTPITCDVGVSFRESNALLIGDDELDLFIFIGEPKDILDSYTDLTGKSPMPPLWSFGLWMSRITYFSEAEGREVARLLRKHRIPSDAINFDTGWFEVDWQCDFEFAPSRFDNPRKMIADLRKDGFHVCLWQLPYFVPGNKLFKEIVDNGLMVRDAKGNVPFEDAIIDFSNPKAVEWYQSKIAGLLDLGVSAIKVDFGEAGPMNAIYHSGRTGFHEHNLYPLRYNKALADITFQRNKENIIWARSAWAGSQRYPMHWGGDAANSSIAMAASIRGGLSFGLSGFSFWSHDIGGFPSETPAELYLRWLPFGMLSSHSRSHGKPPKEPWYFGEEFMNEFRKGVELKYRLMPYVYAQAVESSSKGLPMLRALFVEFPNDPGSWKIDDQYLFGSDILVAPILEPYATSRNVYLPPGQWIDYQSGKVYSAGWHHIAVGEIKVVMLVREGAAIPHAKLAQSTKDIDWSEIDLVVYAKDATKALAKVALPQDNALKSLSLSTKGGRFVVDSNPFGRGVKFNVVRSTGYTHR